MSSPHSPAEPPSPSEEALPDGWVLCESKSLPGRKYYFDRRSGSSLWTKPPLDLDKTSKSKTRRCKKHRDEPSPTKPGQRDEDTQKASLKRKSDGSDRVNASFKRTRQESTASDPHLHSDTPSSSSYVTPQHRRPQGPSSKDFTAKQGNSKNSASKRMEHLRSQLHKDEEQNASPSPRCSSGSNTGTPKTHNYESQWRSQEFVSPNTDPLGRECHRFSPNDKTERPVQGKEYRATNNFQSKAYIPKNSIRDAPSPTSSDPTTAIAHTAAGDYLEIISSPSQFFEATKLICSLQAQLAEELVCRGGETRHERSDTFAAIEEGISSQSVEYSSKNHPATPPHFQRAADIVTSVKSRLNENISDCEKKSRFSSPANDRLAALRSSLGTPTDGVKYNNLQNQSQRSAEQKPVLFENKTNVTAKPVVEHIQPPVSHRPVVYYNRQKFDDNMDVETLREMRDGRNASHNYSASTVTADTHASENVVLVVDTNIFIHDIQFLKIVLDSFITGYKDKPTLVVPWQVINELDRMKDNNNGNQKISSKAKIATDYLYQVLPANHRFKGQTLRDAHNHIYPCQLPDDEILNCCLQQSQRGNAVILLSNDKNLCNRATINSIRAVGIKELKDLLRAETEQHRDTDVRSRMQHYESCIYQLLSNILENEMRARYNTLWQHVLFKAPPWSLLDVLQCLLKHWIAVFSEVFPRIEPLIQQAKTTLMRIYDKGPRVTTADVVSFKDLAYELASKCQIIPDYMELAKLTMERLKNEHTNRSFSPPRAEVAPVDEEKTVVNSFENIWMAFSSYCAKLASMLGINHQLDDRSDNRESAESLRNKWPEYSSHIQNMAYALKRTLTANENSGIEPLHSTLTECLALIGGHSNSIDNDSLRTFCLNNRNMIHEALVKFTQLTELLAHCRSAFSN